MFLFFLRLHCVICKNACLIKAFPERGSFKDILKKDFAQKQSAYKTSCEEQASLEKVRRVIGRQGERNIAGEGNCGEMLKKSGHTKNQAAQVCAARKISCKNSW